MKENQFWKAASQVRRVTTQARNSLHHPIRWHSHPFYELALVFSGECDWKTGTRSRPKTRETAAAGEVLLLPPDAWHNEQIREGGAAKIGWIGFDSEASPPRWSRRRISLGSDHDEIVQLFHTIYQEHSLPENADRTQLALQMLLLLITRQAERTEAAAPFDIANQKSGLNLRQIRCIQAAAYTMRNNLNPPLEIAQVAAFHSLSPAHFSTLFRRHFQMSPRMFLRQARVETAVKLLTTSDLTIKEIAAETGFADSAHFCKAFRALKGQSPNTFRAAERAL